MPDRLIIASVSGGKDSTALCLHLQELGIEYRAVFLDTGWEHPETYSYLRDYLPDKIGPIEWVKAPLGMADLCRKKGMFPSRVRRFCTQGLKVFPMRDYLAALDCEPVNAIGIRRGESRARSQWAEREYSDTYDCEVWAPLVEWTVEDVVAIHQRHDCLPNPLYLRGHERVGCWPCIFARKAEIRRMADEAPWRIDELEALEAEVAAGAAERLAARGEIQRTPPTWFQNPMPTRRPDGTRSGECWPIREVVKWARTTRGGRQVELLTAPERDGGCMRWGLCDYPTQEPHRSYAEMVGGAA